MSNPLGDVEFEAGGQKYRFVVGMVAKALIEDRTDEPYQKFFGRLDSFGERDWWLLFEAGLKRHHDLNATETADVMDALGDEGVGSVIGKALLKAFPKPEKDDKARPTKAKAAGSKTS